MTQNFTSEIDSLELLIKTLEDKFKYGIKNGVNFIQTKEVYMKIKGLKIKLEGCLQLKEVHAIQLN